MKGQCLKFLKVTSISKQAVYFIFDINICVYLSYRHFILTLIEIITQETEAVLLKTTGDIQYIFTYFFTVGHCGTIPNFTAEASP